MEAELTLMSSQTVRLVIVSDNQLFCQCLASVMVANGDFTVVGNATNPDEGFTEAKAQQPEVILIDIALPHNGAFELARQISLELPQVKVVILGVTVAEADILACVEAGASGYVGKDASLDDLIAAIRAVSRGETICSPQVAHSVFSRVAELASERHRRQRLDFANLTAREVEILQLIADGLSNKQIAQQLFLSLHTVKNHVHNILEKLKVRRRSEAARYAFLKGLLKVKRSHHAERFGNESSA
jgi:DNA-binding NarL/FixJ family response regulator